MPYFVEIAPAAQRQIKKLDRVIQQRILRRLEILRENPRPTDAVKLEGQENFYRVRAGDYRIIYQIREALLLVLVVKVGHRREIYRGL